MDVPVRRPRCLDAAYWLLVAGAVLALVAAAMFFTTRVPGEIVDWDPEHARNVTRNLKIVAAVNALGGVVIAAVAAHVRRGSARARLWASGAIALTAIVDLLALATQLIGAAVVLSIVCFVAAAVAMFRPEANRFVRAQAARSAHESGAD